MVWMFGGLAELSMAGVRTREASVERRPTPPPLEAVLKMSGGAKKRVWVHDAPKPSWTVSTLQSLAASATRLLLSSAALNPVALCESGHVLTGHAQPHLSFHHATAAEFTVLFQLAAQRYSPQQ